MASQSDFKAIGYYTSEQYAAESLASGLSHLSLSNLNDTSKYEAIFVRHYHPVNKHGKQDSLHVWFGDYVIR